MEFSGMDNAFLDLAVQLKQQLAYRGSCPQRMGLIVLFCRIRRRATFRVKRILLLLLRLLAV